MKDQYIGEKPQTEGELRLRPDGNNVDRELPPIEQTIKAGAAAPGHYATDIKDPDGDLETPASMPADQQGEAQSKHLHHDLEGQQAGTNGGGHEAS
jgi:hypothetical protein